MPKLIPKYCAWCRTEFDATTNKQIYCSKECKRQSEKAKQLGYKKYICHWCGDEFLSLHAKKYCSKDCKLYANGRKSKRKTPPTLIEGSLAQVNQLARDAGLSYGRYTGKLYAEKHAITRRHDDVKNNLHN